MKGPAIVQIWGIGHDLSPTEGASVTASEPITSPSVSSSPARMHLGIVHEGGLVWDLKWRPGLPPDSAYRAEDAALLPG